MNTEKELKKVYIEYLENLSQRLNDCALKKEKNSDFDEAIMDKIRLNIAKISKSMFITSFDGASKVVDKAPELKEIITKYNTKHEQIFHMYMHFLDNFFENWKSNMEKSRKFDDLETYRKENVKFEIMKQIKEEFINTYNSMDWEEVS